MNFLTIILGTLTPRMRAALIGVVLVASLLAVPASLTAAPAEASTAKPSNTHSNTTVALRAIFGTNNVMPVSAGDQHALRRPASDVYHVAKSYVEKMRDKCRHLFKKRHKRKICVTAQGARAVQTKYFVTHARIHNFWNKYKLFKRQAKWCRHHHKRCVHRFPNLGVSQCGPLALPRWHFIAECLSRKSADNYDRWFQLSFFRRHTVPSDVTTDLRLANKTYAVHDTTHTVVIKDWDFFGGPNTIIKFSRPATVNAYHNVWAADSALAAANGLCTAAGVAGKSAQLAIACASLATATIGKIKSDLTNAYNEGKCLQLKYYDIFNVGPVPNIRNAFPSSVTSCVSNKLARRR